MNVSWADILAPLCSPGHLTDCCIMLNPPQGRPIMFASLFAVLAPVFIVAGIGFA